MLDDFKNDNGATRVVPKSHLRDDYAISDEKYKDERQITGNEGDVIILNGSLCMGQIKIKQ